MIISLIMDLMLCRTTIPPFKEKPATTFKGATQSVYLTPLLATLLTFYNCIKQHVIHKRYIDKVQRNTDQREHGAPFISFPDKPDCFFLAHQALPQTSSDWLRFQTASSSSDWPDLNLIFPQPVSLQTSCSRY